MATRKKIIPVTNIRAGDIPETDEQVEKILEKMEKKPATKPKVVRKNAQGVEVDIQVDHGTERIVKEKPAAKKENKKPVKQPKPKVERVSKRNPNWKTPVQQTPENFRGMVADAKAGMTLSEIATKYGCIEGLVRFVLQGKGRTQHTGLTPPGIWPEYQKMQQAKSKSPVAKPEGAVGK